MAGKIKLVIIAGPTASSKSDLALYAAEQLNAEIINADSVQVYRYFDIGSAKPDPDARKKVPHHLIDILNPDEEFNAFRFKELARKAVADISSRGKLPIVVGGTGLYIRCFLYDLFEQDTESVMEARKHWEQVCAEKGIALLYETLQQIDPKAAERIHPNDRVRIIRALEVHTATGRVMSDIQAEHRFEESPFDFRIFVPQYPKEEMDARISERSIRIFRSGIIDEVKNILSRGYSRECKPFKSIGYKEALAAADGNISVDDAVSLTVRATKAYAKRQRVWFKKEKNICYINMMENNFKGFFDNAKNFVLN